MNSSWSCIELHWAPPWISWNKARKTLIRASTSVKTSIRATEKKGKRRSEFRQTSICVGPAFAKPRFSSILRQSEHVNRGRFEESLGCDTLHTCTHSKRFLETCMTKNGKRVLIKGALGNLSATSNRFYEISAVLASLAGWQILWAAPYRRFSRG